LDKITVSSVSVMYAKADLSGFALVFF